MVDWYNFCRDICSIALLNEGNIKIGGDEKIVEIDESKFGKRKYNKGKRVEGQWVFGGIERDSNKMFMVSVPNRTKETLFEILEKYVEKGTTIYSDCWSAYQTDELEKYGWKHGTVNHSKYFKDPETGVHTNTIESNWRSTKASLPQYGTVKDLYNSYFSEYMWRRRFVSNDCNAFNKLIEHIVLYSEVLDQTEDSIP
jgi:transposase-like protein